MSGTSVDGVDAVLLRAGVRPKTLAQTGKPFTPSMRAAVQALQTSGPDELERAARVANELADAYAEAVTTLLRESGLEALQITALGAHGQTVRHRPERGYTVQLLNAARLAEHTGIPVVHDLRVADVAAGGQGAPLVPAFHAHVFASASHRRAIVNLGGIANVSLLPALSEATEGINSAGGDPENASASPSSQALGYDTGPGNTLLDLWHQRHRGSAFDEGGRWAAGGRVLPNLLATMLTDPYFTRTPPKSTGRDHFNLAWLERLLGSAGHDEHASQDIQATLAELTAHTVAKACEGTADEVYLCGGGAFNDDLVRRIQSLLPCQPVRLTDELGISPMAVEGAAFAWLAWLRLASQPGNLPAVTGARGTRVLGAITDPYGRLGLARRPAPLRPRTTIRSRR
jgi:anhydro-N-acetylmuramic acid kinase